MCFNAVFLKTRINGKMHEEQNATFLNKGSVSPGHLMPFAVGPSRPSRSLPCWLPVSCPISLWASSPSTTNASCLSQSCTHGRRARWKKLIRSLYYAKLLSHTTIALESSFPVQIPTLQFRGVYPVAFRTAPPENCLLNKPLRVKILEYEFIFYAPPQAAPPHDSVSADGQPFSSHSPHLITQQIPLFPHIS